MGVCPTSPYSDLFPVHVGLRQGCPLSPILFIIFMDRISRRKATQRQKQQQKKVNNSAKHHSKVLV
uniref:Reverse transcriptase domain-containing protein n=1 Tax=Scleropages formosus TaxID=113540 RepID=A0A8C9SYK1_SCLFO